MFRKHTLFTLFLYASIVNRIGQALKKALTLHCCKAIGHRYNSPIIGRTPDHAHKCPLGTHFPPSPCRVRAEPANLVPQRLIKARGLSATDDEEAAPEEHNT